MECDTRMTEERNDVCVMFWALRKLRSNWNVQFTAWRLPREAMQIRNKAKYSCSTESSDRHTKHFLLLRAIENKSKTHEPFTRECSDSVTGATHAALAPFRLNPAA